MSIVAIGARHDKQSAARARGPLCRSRHRLGIRIGRVDQHAERRFGTSSRNSSELLRLQTGGQKITPVALPPGRLRLATRPSLTGSRPMTKTIGMVAVAAWPPAPQGCGRNDHGHLAADQIGRHRRQPIVLTFRPAVFDRDVVALDIAGLVQTFAECGSTRAFSPATGAREIRPPASPAAARAPQAATPPRRSSTEKPPPPYVCPEPRRRHRIGSNWDSGRG